jgi:hypothetical protein
MLFDSFQYKFFGIIDIDYLIIGFGVCIIIYYLFFEIPKFIVIKESFVDNQNRAVCPCKLEKSRQSGIEQFKNKQKEQKNSEHSKKITKKVSWADTKY